VKRVIICLTLALMCGFGMRLPRAEAQDGAYNLPILKINCPTLPGSDEYPFEDWQHECEPGPGAGFTVTDAKTGEVLGTCVTAVFNAPEPQATASCTVPVAYGAAVVVTEDVSTAPAGYLPVEESVAVTAPASADSGEPVEAHFINLLQDQSEDDGPTTQLPSTGSGTTALTRYINHWWD
jgi:hypothetical protein